MSKHYEIRFSGSGGQGMMLMGDIMAKASGCYDGQEILLMKSYGPEARGGACRSELIIDNENITYPAIVAPDFVLAMTQLSCNKYSVDLKAEGALLIDSDLVKDVPKIDASVYAIPITKISEEVTGSKVSANIVALGAITAISSCASPDGVRWAIRERFTKAAVADMNIQAFEAGYNAVKNA